MTSDHILIVDDQQTNLMILQRMLEREGYTISTARSGASALASLEQTVPDLMLLDIMMPEMDGYETLQKIRNNPRLPFIPIIFVSAKQSVAHTVTGLDRGADDYVTKPVNRDELTARIRTLLRLKRSQRDLQRERERMSLLYEISQIIHRSLDVDALLNEALTLMNRVLQATKNSVLMFDDQGNLWRKLTFRDQLKPADLDAAVQTVLREGLASYAVNSGEVQIVSDATTDPRWKHFYDDSNEVGSALAMPFSNYHTKKVIGVFIMINPRKGHFDDEMRPLIAALAEQVSIALTNASSYTRLREAEDSREAFIQMLTHDLRSPLAGMIGCFDALMTTDLSDDGKFFVDLGFRAGAAQQRLIDDLLDVYKYEAGKLVLDFAPTSLKRIGEFVQEQLAASAVESEITLTIDLPDTPSAMLDENKMVRVVSNLVSNGIKWTPANGTITVSGAVSSKKRLITVQVVDTGQGIPAEDLPHIFDKFYQGRKKGKSRGTGLGLTFCQLAVQAHGGTVQAFSEQGRGTTILIELPYKESV